MSGVKYRGDTKNGDGISNTIDELYKLSFRKLSSTTTTSNDESVGRIKSGSSSSSGSGGNGVIPSSYIYHRNIILRVALITRVFLWIYAFAVSQLLSPFDSSAQLNAVSPNTPNQVIGQQVLQLTNHNNTLIDSTIKRLFVKWDSIYYIRIAEYGYEFEQYHAFFPLYPMTLRYLANVNYLDYIILSGFIISNISFILSCIQLLKLGNILFNNQKISFVATLLYCVNPANIFMCALYTESIFNLFVFSGLYYLYGGRYYLNPSRMLGLDAIPTRRNVLCSTIGALLFGCATATRSNGILLCGFIVYYHNATMFTSLFRRIFIILNTLTQKRRSSPVLTHSTSFGKLADVSFDLSDFLLRLTLSVVQSMIIIIPYILFQYYGYQRYCSNENNIGDNSTKFANAVRSSLGTTHCLLRYFYARPSDHPILYTFTTAY
ncbi:phosphatidylinositol glycan [Heterostelium album PN500]|uniref:GPI mannosyltransferase 2 n=1 Tax=Heterostelium pallidum (strain ATCC 26659 / Pp 5 / PN500) TaxID=670386 RepID=D3BPV7_HETP5|nr:phosphatidylinositol glycan [Heterostelium album PN500]EFA76240.1 phosphatidylinositol glycan [Heterostelium album PN500]|eukprot:XP_020428373.1 phosphatidylinositol glycan [Heterostelium album PN500]